MRTCSKCGSYVPEGKLFCEACGKVCLKSADASRKKASSVREAPARTRNTAAGQPSGTDMTQRVFCAAAYFGIFFFLPLIALPNSEEGKFHANQGLVLFLFGLILGGISSATSLVLGEVFSVLSVAYPLLMVYGARNALMGQCVELPLIGKLRILKDDHYFR